MDTFTALKLLVLIFALPAQYYIAQNWSNDQHEQNQAIQSLFTSISSFKDSYLTPESWKKWYVSFVIEKPKAVYNKKFNKKDSGRTEQVSFTYDIAVDVLNFRKSSLYYGESSRVRSPRPSAVLFRVGQVVRHRRLGSYAVIIGWDETLQANPAQIDSDLIDFDGQFLIGGPYYLVLSDQKSDAKKKDKRAYYSQTDLELVHDVTVSASFNS